MRNTVAPRSASSIAHIGPGPMPVSSTTLMPAKGPIYPLPLDAKTNRASRRRQMDLEGTPAQKRRRKRCHFKAKRHPDELPPIYAGSASSCDNKASRSSAQISFSELPPSNETPEAPQLRRS